MDVLESLQKELDEEAAKWESIGITLDHTQHTNSSIFLVKQQIQTVINLMLKKEIITEDEINIEFKTLLLNSMREIRGQSEAAIQKSKIAELLGKPQDIALPSNEVRIVGKDGKEIKL